MQGVPFSGNSRARFGVLWILLSSSAGAAPRNISIQTTLFDSSGAPVSSSLYMKVTLWKDATSTSGADKLWDPGTCVQVTPQDNGRVSYSVELSQGESDTLASLSSSTGVWAEITTGTSATCTDVLHPRIRSQGMLFAMAADVARRALTTSALGSSLAVTQAPVMVGATVASAGVQGLVPAPSAGDEEKYLRGDGTWQSVTGASTTVSSVNLTMPAEWSVSGGPITTSGLIEVTGAAPAPSFAALIGPTGGSSATPTIRTLVEADLPDLSVSKFTSGVLPVSRGGTGGTDAASARTALTIGSSATLSASSANFTGGDISGVTIGASTPGPATFNAFSATLDSGKIWVGNGSGKSAAVSLSGDASLDEDGILTVEKLQGRTLSLSSPSDGEVIGWNDGQSRWEPMASSATFSWSQLSSSDTATLTTNAGFIANRTALMTLTLPATCALGDVVRVAGLGAGGWKVVPNAGQSIYLGDGTGLSGSSGLGSSNAKASADFVCTDANTEWLVTASTATTSM